VYIAFLVDLTSDLHLHSVSVMEAAVADVMTSGLLQNGSGSPIALKVAIYDSHASSASAIGEAIRRFAELPQAMGILGGIFSGTSSGCEPCIELGLNVHRARRI
jgi:hypothetical protein